MSITIPTGPIWAPMHIWATESGDLSSNSYQWSFGSNEGSQHTRNMGVTLLVDCKLVKLSLRHAGKLGDTQEVEVEVWKNNTATGKKVSSAVPASGTDGASDRGGYIDLSATPIEFNELDWLNFKTITGNPNSNGGIITALFLAKIG